MTEPTTDEPEILVEHTFTPTHVFQLRDSLIQMIRRHSSEEVQVAAAQDVAEGLLTDRVIDLVELNRISTSMLAELGAVDPKNVPCDDGSCDGTRTHNHGRSCGALCSCGKGW
ncbi:hypothetical protein MUN78_07080 [Leucobacter allii]|uniref:Uncharacterized protein n=1 Tax=Leucobacter allii TaxID=2932247 RepID=A0ABY4FQK8_9MICO|nr:hypothetical protein [Leucobacter allii]UOQ58580.1 hypothetical protein MUN78_07080 [Leucobacter allii]